MNNNQLIQTLQNILEALMTISVKGADIITMSSVLQALQQLINTEAAKAQEQPQQRFIPEDTEE